MPLIIDPPVSPYSDRSEIENWIAELRQMRVEFTDDEQAVGTIDFNIELAEQWIAHRPRNV